MNGAADQGDRGAQPGTPAPARLRRSLFGYRRADVDRALADRDALLAELRQDVAALWLAFAQHDRMIREGLGGAEASEAAGSTAEPGPDAPAAAEGAESIGRQLSDLDEVLTAIELATQTLERSYAEQIATEPEDAGAQEIPQPESPPEAVEVAEPAPPREGETKG